MSEHPAERHPSPEFPQQSQQPPGAAGELTPRPDHGEDSCRGCGRLRERRALITGGDSGIGRAVALAFAREGADVLFTHLPDEVDDSRETARKKTAVRHGKRSRRCQWPVGQSRMTTRTVSSVAPSGGSRSRRIASARRSGWASRWRVRASERRANPTSMSSRQRSIRPSV